jgi:hypothetical protein
MVDDQSASTPDKGLQRLLNAEGPLDSIFLMSTVEVIDDHVIARKVGMPGIPGLLGSSSWRGGGYIDGEESGGRQDFSHRVRCCHPVMVVDPVHDQDPHRRGLRKSMSGR